MDFSIYITLFKSLTPKSALWHLSHSTFYTHFPILVAETTIWSATCWSWAVTILIYTHTLTAMPLGAIQGTVSCSRILWQADWRGLGSKPLIFRLADNCSTSWSTALEGQINNADNLKTQHQDKCTWLRLLSDRFNNGIQHEDNRVISHSYPCNILEELTKLLQSSLFTKM